MRRVWVRGHENVRKRVLIQAAACNIGLLLRHQTGIGTPRSLQGRALSAICRLIDPFDRPLGASEARLGVQMDTDGARRLNCSSQSCLTARLGEQTSSTGCYGIYDTRANAGTVFVGQTADTPAFAVDCIEKWWRTEGCKHYPEANALQILADGGGSNSCTARAWKFNLQHRLCNRHGLRVSVAHYPPATSKWNPIEHRLFCEVTKNWAGRPLDSYETILKYLRTTRTATGLRVPRAPGPQDLQDRRQGHRRADAGVTHHTRQLPAQMELHHRTHVTKKRKLFLRGA